MNAWHATTTRQYLPAFGAALPMVSIESANRSKQTGRGDAGRWRG